MVEQYRMKAFYRSFYRLVKAQKQGESYFYFVFLIFILSTAFLCVYPEILSSLKRQKHEKPASDKRLARQRRVIRFLHGCKDNKKTTNCNFFFKNFSIFYFFFLFSYSFPSISLLSTSISSSVSSPPPPFAISRIELNHLAIIKTRNADDAIMRGYCITINVTLTLRLKMSGNACRSKCLLHFLLQMPLVQTRKKLSR